MREAGLEPAPSRLVRPPRVAASPCALECKLLQIVDMVALDGTPAHRHVVFGQVVGIHIDDRFIKDGRLDTAAMAPIARCGYQRLRGRRQGLLDDAQGAAGGTGRAAE